MIVVWDSVAGVLLWQPHRCCTADTRSLELDLFVLLLVLVVPVAALQRRLLPIKPHLFPFSV